MNGGNISEYTIFPLFFFKFKHTWNKNRNNCFIYSISWLNLLSRIRNRCCTEDEFLIIWPNDQHQTFFYEGLNYIDRFNIFVLEITWWWYFSVLLFYFMLLFLQNLIHPVFIRWNFSLHLLETAKQTACCKNRLATTRIDS